MICPLKTITMTRGLEPGDEPIVKCDEEVCAWWVFVLGERLCAVNALAQIARMTYEKLGN